MLVAVATIKNEADIIGLTVRHLLDQGVDQVLVADGMSTDGTREVLAGFGGQVLVVDDREPFHRQVEWTNRLVAMAARAGARWAVPFDADEFVCTTGGESLAEFFTDIPVGVTKVYAPVFHYVDFERRWREPKMPKVIYRAFPFACVKRGAHDVSLVGGELREGLVVREVQYRGFEHFCRKIRERNASRPPEDPKSEGAHHWRFDGWTAEQLRPVWDEMVARATVHDPIPAGVRA